MAIGANPENANPVCPALMSTASQTPIALWTQGLTSAGIMYTSIASCLIGALSG